MTTLKTNAAQTAVARRATTPDAAAKVEKAAEGTKKLGEAYQALGIRADAYETAVGSAAYAGFTPEQRDLFSHVYAEMMGHAADGIGALAGKPSPQRVTAAYHEVSNLLEYMNRKARAHGPGVVHVAPSSPQFQLEEHPAQMLQHAYRVKGTVDVDPHILVTLRTDNLPPQRDFYNLSAADVTPEAFVRTLRAELKGAFADVELRVQHEDGGPVAVSKAAGAKPAAETREQKFKRAIGELSAALDNIPELVGRVAEVHYHTAELMPMIAVRTSMKQGPAFEALKPQIEEAVASWLEANGHADLVSRNYLPNTIGVVAKDGALGV